MNPGAQKNSAHTQRFPRKPLPSSTGTWRRRRGSRRPSFPGSAGLGSVGTGPSSAGCTVPLFVGLQGRAPSPSSRLSSLPRDHPRPRSPVALRGPCPRGRQGEMRPVTPPCSSLRLHVGDPRPAEAMGFVLDQPVTWDRFWPRATDVGGSTGSGPLLGTERAPHHGPRLSGADGGGRVAAWDWGARARRCRSARTHAHPGPRHLASPTPSPSTPYSFGKLGGSDPPSVGLCPATASERASGVKRLRRHRPSLFV